MESKSELINHFKALRAAVSSVGGEAYLNLDTFEVEARLDQVIVRLYPQFVVVREGKLDYVHDFADDAWRFAGWRANKFVLFSTLIEKLGFKRFAEECGMPIPRYALEAEHDISPVLVKRSMSTFGYDIRGPFLLAKQAGLDQSQGDYYEEFKLGQIVKLWFWMEQPVCADLKRMPAVIGDGVSSIKTLVSKLPIKPGREIDFERISTLLRLSSINLETVLPLGQQQVVDYLYTSVLDNPAKVEEVLFSGATAMPDWAECLSDMGKTIWAKLASEGWEAAGYTLDAILDNDGKIWFLEFNPNPFMHPSVYGPMMQAIQKQVINDTPILIAGAGSA